MKTAILNEIFVSLQGEGPWVGERHIFVRFQGCDLHCSYCDTPASGPFLNGRQQSFAAQAESGYPAQFERLRNPVTADRLTGLCSRLALRASTRQTISLTGGEPLLQSDFLAEWLPKIKQEYRIFLETNGLCADDLQKIVGMIDVVSMDIKLPSSTGLRPFWDEHRRFLRIAASGRSVVVKAVVTKASSKDELLAAAGLVAACDASIPFILQPASGDQAPEISSLIAFQDAALSLVNDARVIPQVHKLLKVP